VQSLEPIIRIPNPVLKESPCLESEFDSLSGPTLYGLKRKAAPEVSEVVERAPNRIVEILKLGYNEYERTHALQDHVREAVRMTLQCRTSALGGHVEGCPDGHVERIFYNSCGHRFCPRCAYRKQQNWLAKQRKKMLPVRHFHVTFTIPHEFNDLWWSNFKDMADILFQTAAKSLQELMKDPQRTGVQVGIVAALHTWDDRLLRHPHLHCLVTGGGLTEADTWKDSYQPGEKPFLVPGNALMQRFRKLFCRRLERKLKKEQLKLPEGWRKQQMLNMINKVNRTNWEIYVSKPPEDGGPTTEEILDYQAKAVAGGPISQMRIVEIERKVDAWVADIVAAQQPQLGYLAEPLMPNSRFKEVDAETNSVSFCYGKFDRNSGRRVREETEELEIGKFIKRLLWHVTPPKFHAVREYGLYSGAKKGEYEKLRAVLPDTPEAEVVKGERSGEAEQADGRVSLEEYMQQRTHCPVCGKKLEFSRVIPSSVTGKISPRDKALAKALRSKRRRGG
jgi:hypothetical protein